MTHKGQVTLSLRLEINEAEKCFFTKAEMSIKHEFYPKREQSIQMKNMSIAWSEFGQIIEFQQSFNDYLSYSNSEETYIQYYQGFPDGKLVSVMHPSPPI